MPPSSATSKFNLATIVAGAMVLLLPAQEGATAVKALVKPKLLRFSATTPPSPGSDHVDQDGVLMLPHADLRAAATTAYAPWGEVLAKHTVGGASSDYKMLGFLAWDTATGQLSVLGSKKDYHAERLTQFHKFFKKVLAAQLPATKPGDEGAHWASTLCGPHGHPDPLAFTTTAGPASSAPPPVVHATLYTADGANHHHDQAAFYDHFMQPGCPNGHLIEFTVPAFRAFGQPLNQSRWRRHRCLHPWPTPYVIITKQPQSAWRRVGRPSGGSRYGRNPQRWMALSPPPAGLFTALVAL